MTKVKSPILLRQAKLFTTNSLRFAMAPLASGMNNFG
jgi:hypothetical protein